MQVGNDTDLEFEPLLRTGANSGVLKWSEMMEEGNPFAGPQPKRDPVRIRDEDAHTLAAHIHSKKKDGLNVVYVSDIDIVSDYCLYSLSDILRRGFDYELELDNVDFVLNSVDLLAGDEAMIDLRNREAKMRPLTEIQEQVNGFRKQRQQEEERRQKQWKEEIETIQSQLDEAQNNLGSDDSGLAIQRLFTAAENATQRLKQKKEEIEQEKQQALDRLKGEERRQVESLQTRIRWWAILLPPIPPIMLGVLMLGIRAYREESTIQPSRSVRR
jgi:ABC-2 type transport system permease protein